MSQIALSPNPAGTGTFTIASPNSNTNRTLNLPDASGTIMTNSGNEAASFASLSVAGNNISAVNSLGFRNRIINGDMRIDQRNNGASVTVATGGQTYITDRWVAYNSSGATQSFSQEAISNAGFTRALRCTITNAVASGASAFLLFGQRIEGFNVSDLAWGTASAQSVTVSFRVFTSLAGTYGGIIRNGANNRFYAFSFTVSANTWTQVTQTIAGDTSGTWATDNSTGLDLIISMGCGTSLQGATGSWGSTQILGASGQTQLNATAGATFSITGVQLEAGSVATPFERRPYGTELALCQRYAQPNKAASGRFNPGGTTPAFVVPLSPPMRTASPSIVELNLSGKLDEFWVSTRSISSGTAAVYNASGTDGIGFLCNSSTTGSASGIVGLFANAFLFVTEL